jgi:SAM-dependent methyltransferase
MNRLHSVICSSRRWQRVVERELLPWGLTVLELDEGYCERLRRKLAGVTIVQGDATAMPFADARFSAVVCFTMLHHLPSLRAQDRMLAEVARVLRPGAPFAGTDSLGTGRLFRLLHIGDTLVPVAPEGLPDRLSAAGLADPAVSQGASSFRFRANKPAAAAG